MKTKTSKSNRLDFKDVQNLADEIRRRAGSTIFSVCFRKRITGSIRTMVCRLKVTKHLQGGDRAYDPDDYNLLVVWDVGKQGYRSIPLDGILEIRIRGKVWKRK